MSVKLCSGYMHILSRIRGPSAYARARSTVYYNMIVEYIPQSSFGYMWHGLATGSSFETGYYLLEHLIQ